MNKNWIIVFKGKHPRTTKEYGKLSFLLNEEIKSKDLKEKIMYNFSVNGRDKDEFENDKYFIAQRVVIRKPKAIQP